MKLIPLGLAVLIFGGNLAPAQVPDATSPRYLSVAEIRSVSSQASSQSPVFQISDDGQRVSFQWDHRRLSDWEEISSDRHMPGEDYWPNEGRVSPDGKYMAVNATIAGKSWVGLRAVDGGDRLPLISVPKEIFARVHSFSRDGRGLYLMVHQYFLRPRQPPEADELVTEDLDNRLRVSSHYDRAISWFRTEKGYPEAEPSESRTLIAYLDLATKELRRLFTANDIEQLSFSPDGRHVVAVQPVGDGQNYRSVESSSDVYVIELPALPEAPLLDLAVAKEKDRAAGWFDHRDKPIMPVLRRVGIDSWYGFTQEIPFLQWSPDGNLLAYSETGPNTTGDVWVWNLAQRKATNLTATVDLKSVVPRVNEPMKEFIHRAKSDRFGSLEPLLWSPDSRSLYVAAKGYLWRVPVDGSAPANLSRNSGPAGIVSVVSSRQTANQPYEPAAGELLVRTTDMKTHRDGFARFDLARGSLEPVWEGKGLVMRASVEENTRKLYFFEITPDNVGEFFECDLAKGVTQQRTAYAGKIASRKIPERMLLSFTTASGHMGWARLHLPAGARPDAKWPTIIAMETWPNTDAFRMQYNTVQYTSVLERWRLWGLHAIGSELERFNRAGYAMLYIDVPLGTYGKATELRRHILEAYEAATDAAIATGRVNETKLGLYGEDPHGAQYSNRGFTVQTVISGSNRYAAAVSINGYGSLTGHALSDSHYRGLNSIQRWAEEEVRLLAPRMQDHYVHEPARYDRNSALPYFGQVKTPLLLMHNTQLPVVSPERANESFAALLPTGTPTVAVFNNKGSSPHSEMHRRAIVWFNEHLRNGPKISGMAKLPNPSVQEIIEAPIAEPALPGDLDSSPNLP